MRKMPQILSGLSDIAREYDALICDVWGVLHDGKSAKKLAVDALTRFRRACGPVVLLSNAPRPVAAVRQQFARFGVPAECYDRIVTSGVTTRNALAERSGGRELRVLHIGPERDRGVFEGLPINCVEMEGAEIVLCTGLFDDDNESPEDYRPQLEAMIERRLVLLCANPDIVVQRGGKLVWCAGAIAREFERLGGQAIYFGKPHLPIYKLTLEAACEVAGQTISRPLAVGDGLETDIAGANNAGLDALFIADGIHGETIPDFTPEEVQRFFEAHGVTARAAMRSLTW